MRPPPPKEPRRRSFLKCDWTEGLEWQVFKVILKIQISVGLFFSFSVRYFVVGALTDFRRGIVQYFYVGALTVFRRGTLGFCRGALFLSWRC